MATKPKLSKDEEWLKLVFKSNFDKLDEKSQEGGKNRKQFLKDASEFRGIWMQVYLQYTDIVDAKWETDKQKNDLKVIVKLHEKAEKFAKTLDLDDATSAAKACLVYFEIIQKREAPKMAIAPHGRNYSVIAGGTPGAGMAPDMDLRRKK